jgi:hypothetical protein
MAIEEYASLVSKWWSEVTVDAFHFYHVVCIVKGFLDVDRWQSRKSRTAAEHLSMFRLWGGDDEDWLTRLSQKKRAVA